LYAKSFSSISKLVAIILILTCSILFTDIAMTQPKDSQSNPTNEQSDNSDDSKSLIYIGIAVAMVVIAVALLLKKSPDKDKKTETEKNTNAKDSTSVIKSDTTQIKK
jgi:hypothetical protein